MKPLVGNGAEPVGKQGERVACPGADLSVVEEVPGCLHGILTAPTPLGVDLVLTSHPPPVFLTSTPLHPRSAAGRWNLAGSPGLLCTFLILLPAGGSHNPSPHPPTKTLVRFRSPGLSKDPAARLPPPEPAGEPAL